MYVCSVIEISRTEIALLVKFFANAPQMCGERFEKEKCPSAIILAGIEAECSIFRQNEGSRSIIWIVNAFHRLSQWRGYFL